MCHPTCETCHAGDTSKTGECKECKATSDCSYGMFCCPKMSLCVYSGTYCNTVTKSVYISGATNCDTCPKGNYLTGTSCGKCAVGTWPNENGKPAGR